MPDPPETRSTLARAVRTLDLWFGVTRQVTPAAYAASGFALAAVKYAVEFVVIWWGTGRFFTPWEFVNPIFSFRVGDMRAVPGWMPWILAAWALPFLWISVTMSVRRAVDSGWSPWTGLYVLLPFINVPFMLGMCLVPSRARQSRGTNTLLSQARATTQHALIALALGALLGIVMFTVCVFVLKDYGSSLFLATPFLMGAMTAYVYNSPSPQSYTTSIFLGMLAVFCGAFALFLFALEGAVCLIMALPLIAPLGLLGGVLGKAIADAARRPVNEMVAALLVFPLVAIGESRLPQDAVRESISSIDIAAPIDVVWREVVGFDEITEPPEWYFRLGIACPLRARIVGSGVGATRYCEFSTGTFVEPITVWAEPHRLAFDVADQPVPLIELSPFPAVHPPHLDDYLRSIRGEFVLTALEDGGTRLEGHTWYRFAMYPQWYWCAWSDLMIHRIHLRVLRHIQAACRPSGQLQSQRHGS